MCIETAALLPLLEGAAAVATVAGALGGKSDAPKVQAPEKPPQQSKQPDRNAIAAANMFPSMTGGSAVGNGSTFLTGSGGVPTSSLTLGKNTLLGQ